MANLIWLPKGYKISEKLEKDIQSCQGVEGKIIEEELKPFVRNRVIQGLKLEPSAGLHTLRMSIGENDLVIHMAKESLKALQLTPSKRTPRNGLLVRLKENEGVEPYLAFADSSYNDFGLDLAALERGISGETVRSVLEIMKAVEDRAVVQIYPSYYYEDWVQIHFKDRALLLRIEPHCLWGIGTGKTTRSTLSSSKDDTIFYRQGWMDRVIGRYYKGECCGGSSYDNWHKAKVKVKREE